ncbi:MAG: hypothetical protein QMO91_08710 [Candidatus Tisiphia sp.]|nr:hypothetical protein [Candidatus Tisiphia sp.]
MKRKIFKSKSNSNIQALNKNQHYIESQDPPSKKVSFKYPLVTEIINYEEKTDEEDDEVVVQAKPIGWRTKV